MLENILVLPKMNMATGLTRFKSALGVLETHFLAFHNLCHNILRVNLMSFPDATFLERWDRRLTSAFVALLQPFWRPLGILLMLTGHTPASEGDVMRRFSCGWIDYTDYVNE